MREMKENTAHASSNAGRSHGLSFILATIAGLFMTITGALGTGEAPLWVRVAFWLTVMNSGSLIGMSVSSGVRAWGRLNASPWIEGLAVATGIAIPLTLIVTAARSLFFSMPMPSMPGMVWLFFYVWIVSVAMTALDGIIAARSEGSAQADPLSLPIESRFHDRLPAHIRAGALIALEAEDHYLRVHTSSGDALILMRLSDAIAEIDAGLGAQTHRSWWVSRAAVQHATKGDGKGELILTGGLKAPVSRSHLSGLVRAGWFQAGN